MIIGLLSSFFKKFQYNAVHILYGTVHWTNIKQDDKITYVLKENGFGKRKLTVYDYGMAESLKKYKEIPFYLEYVIPWLEGAIDDDIIKNYENINSKPKSPVRIKTDKKKDNIIYLKKE